MQHCVWHITGSHSQCMESMFMEDRPGAKACILLILVNPLNNPLKSVLLSPIYRYGYCRGMTSRWLSKRRKWVGKPIHSHQALSHLKYTEKRDDCEFAWEKGHMRFSDIYCLVTDLCSTLKLFITKHDTLLVWFAFWDSHNNRIGKAKNWWEVGW